MKNLSEFLYGDDYSDKLEQFNKLIEEIHNDYDGDFDTSGYFIMETHNTEGKVKLTFDKGKEIPTELKENILTVFREIWN